MLGPASRRKDGNDEPELQSLTGIEHSAWAAFNAVCQYINWERPTRGSVGREREERRLAATMFGQGADLRRKAWSTALEMSGVR